MKITVMTSLLAKWYVDVDAAHLKVFSGQFLVISWFEFESRVIFLPRIFLDLKS